MKGYFITLEGGESSGKTTVIAELQKNLEARGYRVLVTREPGGSELAEQIRDLIIDNKMDYLTEAYLFAASRREHLMEKIIPALKNGKIVLCDRFIDSSLVYQGYGRELGVDLVWEINQKILAGYLPDLTLFIDVRPEIGLERITKEPNKNINRLDLEKIAFHKKVYRGYGEILKKYDRIKRVNGEQELKKVVEEALNLVEVLINENS